MLSATPQSRSVSGRLCHSGGHWRPQPAQGGARWTSVALTAASGRTSPDSGAHEAAGCVSEPCWAHGGSFPHMGDSFQMSQECPQVFVPFTMSSGHFKCNLHFLHHLLRVRDNHSNRPGAEQASVGCRDGFPDAVVRVPQTGRGRPASGDPLTARAQMAGKCSRVSRSDEF